MEDEQKTPTTYKDSPFAVVRGFHCAIVDVCNDEWNAQRLKVLPTNHIVNEKLRQIGSVTILSEAEHTPPSKKHLLEAQK